MFNNKKQLSGCSVGEERPINEHPVIMTSQLISNNFKSSGQLIVCPKCPGKTFKKKKSLLSHNSVVHGEQRFKCSTCDKKYVFQSQLERHEKHHKHKCNLCNEKFSSFMHLKKHNEDVHSDIFKKEKKMKQCSKCEAVFPENEGLRDHIRLKHDNVMFGCEICKKEFGYKRNLANHIRVVHDKLKYDCHYPNCNVSYLTKRALKNHIKRHESGQEIKNPKSDEKMVESDVSLTDKSFSEFLNSTESWRKKCDAEYENISDSVS